MLDYFIFFVLIFWLKIIGLTFYVIIRPPTPYLPPPLRKKSLSDVLCHVYFECTGCRHVADFVFNILPSVEISKVTTRH